MKSFKIMTNSIATLAIAGILFGTAGFAYANNDAMLKLDLDGRGPGSVNMNSNTKIDIHSDDKRMDDHDWNDDRNDDHTKMVNLVGTITAINGTTLTVKSLRDGTSYTISANNETIWKNSNITLSKLSVNDTVVVRGDLSGTTITASAIYGGNWKNTFPENGNWNNLKPGIMGIVTNVDSSAISVKNNTGATYRVDVSDAKLQKEKGTTISINDIDVGDTVFVQGAISGQNIKATNVFDVEIRVEQAKDNYNPDVSGKVTAINNNSITIVSDANVTYTIDISDAKMHNSKNEDISSTYTFSKIKVGDNLWVKGKIDGKNVDATSVVDTDLAIKAVVDAHPGFFARIGLFFKGLFGGRHK